MIHGNWHDEVQFLSWNLDWWSLLKDGPGMILFHEYSVTTLNIQKIQTDAPGACVIMQVIFCLHWYFFKNNFNIVFSLVLMESLFPSPLFPLQHVIDFGGQTFTRSCSEGKAPQPRPGPTEPTCELWWVVVLGKAPLIQDVHQNLLVKIRQTNKLPILMYQP